MKKLIILFLGLAIISCGGSDDDESMGRTTDPFIGSWSGEGNEGFTGEHLFTVNANGTFSNRIIENGVEYTNSGTWSNLGSDFNALTQSYRIIGDDDNSEPETTIVRHNEDFSEFVSDGDTFVRR